MSPFGNILVTSIDVGCYRKEIEDITGDSFTWTVDLPAGTQVMVALEADSGEAWSGAVSVSVVPWPCCTTLTLPGVSAHDR